GYAADSSAAGVLARHRPDRIPLDTTNGDHATGDGPNFALALSALSTPAAVCDLAHAQVLRRPAHPAMKTKVLAVEALCGTGGLLDACGARFVREVERREVVT
ncbi:hypothetical protein C8R45DRAFT_787827, partial [Mycena sanguinolenta]